jgi:aminobenzoyl-glutamate utilization protein A
MVAAGVLDDVDYLVGHHLYSGWETGQVACGLSGYLATEKFDALFTGEPAHAAACPQCGKNALLAAATAVLNLYAIARHRHGVTRINVGRLNAGTGRNVIPAHARLAIETRGSTTALNEYMYASALRILQAAADMHECQLEIYPMGSAQSADSDQELVDRVTEVAQALGRFSIRSPEPGGGSEDFTYMMQRVQSQGGWTTNIGIGADLGGHGHHTATFDIDENALKGAVILQTCLVLDLARASSPKGHREG